MRRRNSLRRPGWDYSAPGYYFVAINVQGRWHWFGECIGGVMVLSEMGEVVRDCILQIEKHHDGLYTDTFVVMPDHVHLLVRIDCDRGVPMERPSVNRGLGHESMVSPQSGSLSVVIRTFKMAVTRLVRRIDPEFSWQRGYHDDIIRDDLHLNNVRRYIKNNPRNFNKQKHRD